MSTTGSEDGWIVSDPNLYCRCCWRWKGNLAEAPGGVWAHGVWESLANLLDAPLRKAFEQHLAVHQCTWFRPDGVLADCQEAWDLYYLTSDGRNVPAIGAPHVDLAAHREDT